MFTITDNHDIEPLQSNHYYPFGMRFNQSAAYTADTENRYLYNGKELQQDLGLDWYDYGARFYDAAIGRWSAVDPLAEEFYYESPFCYVGNNPLLFLDPDGRIKVGVNASVGITQGIIAAGAEFLGISYTPVGATELKLTLSLSIDTERGSISLEFKGSHTDIKEGSYSAGVGAGGGETETKTSEFSLKGEISKSNGIDGSATVTPAGNEYTKTESATMGVVTVSAKEGGIPVVTIGLKKGSLGGFLLGANAAANISIEKSPAPIVEKVEDDRSTDPSKGGFY